LKTNGEQLEVWQGWEYKQSEASWVDEHVDKSAIDLSNFKSAQDLNEAINGDVLKTELSKLGLKCGGTPLDRAKRLFMTKDTPLDQLPKKMFAKPQNEERNGNGAGQAGERRVDLARQEVIVTALLNQLRPTLEATLRRAERRQTQTIKEREQELEEELHGSQSQEDLGKRKDDEDDDSDDEDAPIYNPKGVPLRWDGKPIPYWLFKLHGLNHFYSCEICGNESYRGRRNFEKHFADAKHAYGMKCLGIPNTNHFHGVTKIDDAQELWTKLQISLEKDRFDGDKEEI
jgi:splicing factor 3A subunit 3